MRRAQSGILTAVLLALLCSCQDAPNLYVRHLFRPLDMATVCMDDEGKATSIDECADDANTLYGFVANGERSGLSKVNLRTGKFEDLDKFIPSYNPVVVGDRPVSVVSLVDGTALITANYADASLTRLDSVTLARDEHSLPSRPAHILQSGESLLLGMHPKDSSANGQLIRVSLASFGDSAAEVEVLQLPDWPSDMVLNPSNDSLYVSYINRAYISRIDLTAWQEVEADRVGLANACRDDLDNNDDGLVDQADYGCRIGTVEAETPAEPLVGNGIELLGLTGFLPQCMNGVDDNGDGLTDYPEDPLCREPVDALENRELPVLSRLARTPDGAYLYATNARDYTVVVIDLATMSRVDVNAEGLPGANPLLRRLGIADIQLQSYESLLDIEIVAVSTVLDDETAGTQFLAYVSSATGKIIIVDVTAADGTPMHRFRDGDSSDSSIPFQPKLFVGEEQIELGGGRRNDYPSFGEYIANKTVPGGDEDVKSHYGIVVTGEPRVVRNELWDITHQGAVLKRDVALGQFDTSGDSVVFETIEKPFCAAGVEVGDQLIVTAPPEMNCAKASFQSVALTVSEVKAQSLVLEKGTLTVFEKADTTDAASVGSVLSDDVLECLTTAVQYAVRVPKGTYTVRGNISGYLHPWTQDASGSCVIDESLEATWTQGRLKEWVLKDAETIPLCPLTDDLVDTYFAHPNGGTMFQNHAFQLRVLPGCDETETPGEYGVASTPVDTRWRFLMNSSFEIQAVGSLGTPRRLHWNEAANRVFVVDSGLERVVSITPSSGTVSRTDIY